MKLKRLTPQLKEKYLNLISSKREIIPWQFIPPLLIHQNNEQFRDCGIDGVKFNGNSISEIVQMKYHHKLSYLNINEIQTFLNKCQQQRYKNIKKKLILHGCKLSNKLKALIESNGIAVENV